MDLSRHAFPPRERLEIFRQQLPLQQENDALGRSILHVVAERMTGDSTELLDRFRFAAYRSPGWINIDAPDSFGRTPLHITCQKGLAPATRALLDAGARSDLPDYKKRLPLHWAVFQGDLSLLKVPDSYELSPCLLHRCDINEDTPLLLAIKNYESNPEQSTTMDHLRSLHELWLVHVEKECGDEEGWGLVHLAAARGYLKSLKALLESGIAATDYQTKLGRTALSLAAEHGKLDAVQLLVGLGRVDLNIRDRKYGRTPLSWAALGGHSPVLRFLLDPLPWHDPHEVDPDSKDLEDRTPLFYAVSSMNVEMVRILATTGMVNPQSMTKDKSSPLLKAREKGNQTILHILEALNQGSYPPHRILTGEMMASTLHDARRPTQGAKDNRHRTEGSLINRVASNTSSTLERKSSGRSIQTIESFSTSLYAVSEHVRDTAAASARSSISSYSSPFTLESANILPSRRGV
ncbi:hypothetical protein jhhlp_008198 [Lomentospora prolificans]|uniref:Uncharacterized protein n=1 Tax=Lomentospora prolificans TaxID=41688 RepID=A0A2N3MZB2_9PEZI|nr:hypothetical protein jhhlp_008198 [Lomentospora prolificans]